LREGKLKQKEKGFYGIVREEWRVKKKRGEEGRRLKKDRQT